MDHVDNSEPLLISLFLKIDLNIMQEYTGYDSCLD